MDLQEVGRGCGDWMELAQDRDRWPELVSAVRNLWVPKIRGISWLAAEPVSFSRRTLLHGVSKYFRKILNTKFHENPFNGSRVVPCGRTDRRDEDNSRFSQFCKRA
jgi:hypothetical protein